MKAALKKLFMRLKTMPVVGKPVRFAIAFYRIPRTRAELIQVMEVIPRLQSADQDLLAAQMEMNQHQQEFRAELRELRQNLRCSIDELRESRNEQQQAVADISRRLGNGLYTIALPGLPAFRFEVHTDDDQFISTEIARNRVWEPFETEIFCKLCSPAGFVLDIGANIGWYSIVASLLVGNEGRVIAFEPDPDNYGVLCRNLRRCAASNVQPLQVALGDSSGNRSLYLSDVNRGDHRMFDVKPPRVSVPIQGETLDDVLRSNNRLPDLVKADTQGSEARILRGAKQLLAGGWRPVWLLEFWPFGLQSAGTEIMEMPATLHDLGYELFEVSERDQKLRSATAETLFGRATSDLHPDTQGATNLLAIPRGSRLLENLKDFF